MHLTPSWPKSLKWTKPQGFLIGEVVEGMGAYQAGLKTGDIIKKVDGVKINTFSDLTGYLSTKRPDEKSRSVITTETETIRKLP